MEEQRKRTVESTLRGFSFINSSCKLETQQESKRAVNWNPADCTAPLSVQSAENDVSRFITLDEIFNVLLSLYVNNVSLIHYLVTVSFT